MSIGGLAAHPKGMYIYALIHLEAHVVIVGQMQGIPSIFSDSIRQTPVFSWAICMGRACSTVPKSNRTWNVVSELAGLDFGIMFIGLRERGYVPSRHAAALGLQIRGSTILRPILSPRLNLLLEFLKKIMYIVQ